jgi:hypothetical protein
MATGVQDKPTSPLQRLMNRKDWSVRDLVAASKRKAQELGFGPKGELPRHTIYRLCNGEANRQLSHQQVLVLFALSGRHDTAAWTEYYRDRYTEECTNKILSVLAECEVPPQWEAEFLGLLLTRTPVDDAKGSLAATQVAKYRQAFSALEEVGG